MRQFGLFLILILTLTPPASATLWSQVKPHADNEEECSTVDLRPELGPVRDQGDIGWCYANAAADLLTFYYRDSLHGDRVSSGYTALIYNEKNGNPALAEGGAVDQAMKRVPQEGLCPESLEKEVLGEGPHLGIKEKLDHFVQLKIVYDQGQQDPAKWQEYLQMREQYRRQKSSIFLLRTPEFNDLFRHSTTAEFPLNFANYLCNGHRIFPKQNPPHMKSRSKEDPGNPGWALSPRIHRQLEAGQPVAVSFSMDFFLNPNVPDRHYSWLNDVYFKKYFPQFYKPTVDGDHHATLIVGRKWNKARRTCDWILRNSWGPSCAHYRNPLYQQPDKCQDGNLFIDERFFETQVMRMFYFAPAH